MAQAVAVISLILLGYHFGIEKYGGFTPEELTALHGLLAHVGKGIALIGVFSLIMCLLELIEKELHLQKSIKAIMDKVKKEDTKKILEGLKDEDLQPMDKNCRFTVSVLGKNGELKPLPCDCDEPCKGCKSTVNQNTPNQNTDK